MSLFEKELQVPSKIKSWIDKKALYTKILIRSSCLKN